MIVAVTFFIPTEINSKTLKEKFLETVPIYKETSGLIEKFSSTILKTRKREELIALTR